MHGLKQTGAHYIAQVSLELTTLLTLTLILTSQIKHLLELAVFFISSSERFLINLLLI